jgi:uncharacterized integral membrane protein
MNAKGVLIAVLVFLMVILMIQNSGLAHVRLYFWSIYIPLFLMVLAAFLIGLLVGYLAAHQEKRRDRKLAASFPSAGSPPSYRPAGSSSGTPFDKPPAPKS